ncbi:MAG: NAD-dependent epimerase/dehydratase family protein [Chloroflexi bacterium]|nr:MAG: NAD-dependent epimerase/dehydratase family protein [Chloroflexota bacterium]
MDVAGSGAGLLLLWPLLVLVAVLIKMTSQGPVFYRAVRIGQGARPFVLYKFRTMAANAHRTGPAITANGDPRITRVGRVLRRTKLDELPQLFNVLRGEMSLVGPRPEDPRYIPLYNAEQRQVLAVRPGMTSAASMHYRDEEIILAGDDWEKVYREQILPHKLALDLAYLQERSALSDLLLIGRTVGALCRAQHGLNLLLKLRNRHLLLLDALIFLLTPALAVALRLEGVAWWPQLAPALLFYTGVSLLIKIGIFYLLGLYRRYWQYAGVNDLLELVIGVGAATFIIMGLFMGAFDVLVGYGLAMYRSVPLIDGLLTGLATAGTRFGLRSLNYLKSQHQVRYGGRRTLIVGAGDAGTLVMRELRANPALNMEPVAFVDDDPLKVGATIHGLPVAGVCNDAPALIKRLRIRQVMVAIPSAPLGRQLELTERCRRTGADTHSLPGVYQILAGHKTVSPLPEIDVHQLLHRPPIETDRADVQASLRGQTVLVTGAGGSIGSELCRQVAGCAPGKLILLGHGENSIFEIGLDLRLHFPRLKTCPVIVDVRDAAGVEQVVEQHRPDVIFHAAAHKHVPFMQSHAHEAVSNNIQGTQNVLAAAEKFGVPRLVMISTDKAVNPTSIMGATKRMGELLVMAAAQRSGRAYMAVRFGNVLGSRGSVLRVFKQQIAAGGPLTVTHPEMRRYFMTIPEAVQLVLHAGVLGRGGEVFVLDMGKPVRILDMALELIRLAGLEPERDINIEFTGIRPGEKLDEELFLSSEHYRRTKHQKIFRVTHSGALQIEALENVVQELLALTRRSRHLNAADSIQDALTHICYYIDKYQPQAAVSPAKSKTHPQQGPLRPASLIPNP